MVKLNAKGKGLAHSYLSAIFLEECRRFCNKICILFICIPLMFPLFFMYCA